MKRGLLLLNTGSPDRPTIPAVRRYLKAFLMDSNVIDLPWIFRALLVHGIILPRRPPKTAAAYQSIWTTNGSPLVHHTTTLAQKLEQEINQPVAVGMGYGTPSIANAIDLLLKQKCTQIDVLPLFPHFAQATSGSGIQQTKKILNNRAILRVIPPFYNHPAYIDLLAKSLKNLTGHLLISYHALPLRHIKKMAAPTYLDQCNATTTALIKTANLNPDFVHVAFQSRMGRNWIQPDTSEQLQTFPQQGIKHLTVICPSFFCDGLETLEEIHQRAKHTFLQSGGKTFRPLPSPNSTAAAIHCLKQLYSTT
jgi:ferrochelatase